MTNAEYIAANIIEFVSKNNHVKREDLAELMQIPNEERFGFENIVEGLADNGDVYINPKGKVCIPQAVNIYKGVFCANPKGFGFVMQESVSDTHEEPETRRSAQGWNINGIPVGDIFVNIEDTNGALNRDIVLCRLLSQASGRGNAQGKVIKIIKRGHQTLCGTYIRPRKGDPMRQTKHWPGKGYGVFIPDGIKAAGGVFIAAQDALGALSGQKVVVRLVTQEPPLHAEVVEVLGNPNAPGVDTLSIVRMHEIPDAFGHEVMDEASAIPEQVHPHEFAGRLDMRSLPTITIDGEDTKDVDDAISIERLDGGGFRLGVHIADVAHYVRAGSALDLEARRRGTSVYLADRVIPMLPQRLSNGICSLNAGCDRLALSCIMEIDQNGDIVTHNILESVIHIALGTTYTKVEEVLNGNASGKQEALFVDMLQDMKDLAGVLYKRRIARGSVEFGFRESRIVLDDDGWPIDLYAYERNTATGIIEEFMIAANETVAEEYYKRGLPFVYRIHRRPGTEKLQMLEDALGKLGIVFSFGEKTGPKAVAELMQSVAGEPAEAAVSRMVLRSLKQAVYSNKNHGHFGLASRYYTHFTSPIRRYPDLMVHRLIKKLAGFSAADIEQENRQIRGALGEICLTSSLSERRADLCARDVDDLKKAQFMQGKLGEHFSGVISGVTSWGIFVELENTAEGMVSPLGLEERMEFDQDRLAYIGKTNKYALGDKVYVKVKDIDLERRKINLSLLES